MDSCCATSVSAAQADSYNLQVQVAVAKKANDATKIQGEMIVQMLQSAAKSPPSDRATLLDVQA
jgi:hypothetical protein